MKNVENKNRQKKVVLSLGDDVTGSYSSLFSQRGSAYDRAMRLFPDARAQEFAQAVAAASLRPGMVVVDVPAGSGYLQRYLPPGCMWQWHEPCDAFMNHGAGGKKTHPLLPLPWGTAEADAAISVAALHHLENKGPLFEELFRVVRPGGRLVVSDVATGSSVAPFLDDYVGAYNSTGHKGVYVGLETELALMAAGWRLERAAPVALDWVFDDTAAMADSCHSLFDLRHASPSQTLAAIESLFGCRVMWLGVGILVAANRH